MLGPTQQVVIYETSWEPHLEPSISSGNFFYLLYYHVHHFAI